MICDPLVTPNRNLKAGFLTCLSLSPEATCLELGTLIPCHAFGALGTSALQNESGQTLGAIALALSPKPAGWHSLCDQDFGFCPQRFGQRG